MARNAIKLRGCHDSGGWLVHATLSGVVTAMVIPMRGPEGQTPLASTGSASQARGDGGFAGLGDVLVLLVSKT